MDFKNLTGKAALFEGAEKPFRVQEFPVSAPQPGQALLRLIATGVCGTDVHIHHGRLSQPTPLIIGHEFIGEIVALGSDSDAFQAGDRVIFNMAKPCGKCKLCRTGDSANCLSFTVAYARNPMEAPHFFGGFAEYCYAQAEPASLIKIPAHVDAFAAALFPCAGPTIIHSLKLGGIFENKAAGVETAVVQGAGPLGLFAALWLAQCGVPEIYVTVRDKNSSRAKLITEMTNATVCTAEEMDQKVAEGFAADVCIECSGAPVAFLSGCNLLRNRGKYLVPGQYSNSGSVPLEPQMITFKALQIIGSSQYDSTDVQSYIDFLSEHAQVAAKMTAGMKAFPVAEINEAMECAAQHAASKVVLTP